MIVAGAQLGPIALADTRAGVVKRLLALLHEAKSRGAELIVFPELALTTFFPRWWMEDAAEIDAFFETEMPGPDTTALFDEARRLGLGFSLGYAEKTPDGHRYNTSILVDAGGRIVLRYRKIHLPGHAEHEPWRPFQHLEKRYFEVGDLGWPVTRYNGAVVGMCICNDRRWPETYRVMGLQGVELVLLGYNTPSTNSQKPEEGPQKRQFHNRLTVQAGAYQNSTWSVAVAKGGTEDGHHMIAGSMIVNPDGEIIATAASEGDELIFVDCDLDATIFGKQTI